MCLLGLFFTTKKNDKLGLNNLKVEIIKWNSKNLGDNLNFRKINFWIPTCTCCGWADKDLNFQNWAVDQPTFQQRLLPATWTPNSHRHSNTKIRNVCNQLKAEAANNNKMSSGKLSTFSVLVVRTYRCCSQLHQHGMFVFCGLKIACIKKCYRS